MDKDLEKIRHSASHVLAAAIKKLYPKVKLGIGPAIEDGFYYDFDNLKITENDLKKIEKEMQKIIKANYKFKKIKTTKEKAKKLLKNEKYKLDLLKDIKSPTFYESGDFIDLCAGLHISSTNKIKAFKLLNIAGAYWKGDSKKPMLTRIYGTAFKNKKQLEEFLKTKLEIKKRDHLMLGKQLDIFGIYPEVGAGLVVWHPKGSLIREIIEDFWKEEHKKRGYLYCYTPHIGNKNLWKKSGHLQFYKEYMYPSMKIDKIEYLIKPMNCPFHIQIYKSKLRSYRDLPLRYCELGTVYRYEISGTLHGLTRVRGFTQDDAHIFCTHKQLQKEIENSLELAIYMMKTFSFKDFKVDLSIRNPKQKKKYLGNDRIWKISEEVLRKALNKRKIKYEVAKGEAVFYGPKIDIKLVDSLGREWQGPTIQVDFNFPEKFNITYEGKDGKKHQVVMIHRTVIGSMERFIGCLIEHYGGKFPLWLSPSQVRLLTLTSKNIKFAEKVLKKLKENNIGVELDSRQESISKKVRDAQLEKINKIVVIGNKEQKNNSVAVRTLDGKIKTEKLDKFTKNCLKEIKNKC